MKEEQTLPVHDKKEPAFHVREVPVNGDAILSPMDGYSDLPFRSLCRDLGSAMSYTEFVNARGVQERPHYVARKLEYNENERPVVFQLYGEDPDEILKAAIKVQDLGPDIIDVNMGCPAKGIANRGAGAGLMRTPLVIARIFRKLTAALDVPVTGKIRLGWDDDCKKYRLVARIIEENGGSLLAVHGRTRVQAYGGEADWDAIAEIRQEVSIPVIGNGDVVTVSDIEKMKAHTGCEAVMIGRGAIQNPWIFARMDREAVAPETVRETLLIHMARSLEFYGEERGLVLLRKYAAQYLAPYRLPKRLRRKLLTLEQPADFIALLEEIYQDRMVAGVVEE